MIKIQIFKENSRYKINIPKVKRVLESFFQKEGKKNLNISVAFVGKKTMLEIAKKYYKKDQKLHNIFSFEELKEIVVCLDAIKTQKELYDLLIHSAKHIIGKHHKQV